MGFTAYQPCYLSHANLALSILVAQLQPFSCDQASRLALKMAFESSNTALLLNALQTIFSTKILDVKGEKVQKMRSKLN